MKRFQEGSNAAFEEIYSRYSDRLFAYFLKMFRMDRQKAADFTQDLFIKVIDNKAKFDTDRRFKSWIFTIATYMCRTDFRKKGDISIEEEHYQGSEEINNHYDAQLFKRLLKTSVDALSYNHKAVFILRHQHHLSVREVAEIMDCSEGTVKSRLYYATNKLAQKLAEFQPDQKNMFKLK